MLTTIKHRDQTFDYHQAFADLLNKSYKNSTAQVDLNRYSLFQSAPKIHRRFRNSTGLHTLLKISIIPHTHPDDIITLCPLPNEEREMVYMLLRRAGQGQKLHPHLYALVAGPPGTILHQ